MSYNICGTQHLWHGRPARDFTAETAAPQDGGAAVGRLTCRHQPLVRGDSMNRYRQRQSIPTPAILPPMRVIAGRYKGRRLIAPTGLTSRPILDRVKVSLFDWLGSKLQEPGRLPPISVCDLFCAAGSQGIEALSRGATFCAFVEKDRVAVACLRKNLDALGAKKEAVVVNQPAESVALRSPGDGGFGLVFVDPPYRLSEDVSEGSPAARVFAGLGTRIATQPDALVLWRHDDKCTLPTAAPGGWMTIERRSWGAMAITMFQQSQVQA